MKDLLTLKIKNMVCERCILAVWKTLIDIDAVVERVELGIVYLSVPLSLEQLKQVETTFIKLGFEILSDNQSEIVEKVKNSIHEKFQNLNETQWQKTFSTELEKNIGKDYSYISHLFSMTEGITIEKYLSKQKIEKVKEFLIYNELSLVQIADQLGFSSTQYLSSKFKQSTGMTPSAFKKLSPYHLRKKLDQ